MKNILNYYLTCEGTNPFQANIQNSTIYTNQVKAELTQLVTLIPACNLDVNIQQSFHYIDNINLDLFNLVDETQCGTIYNVFNTAINQGLCNYIFTGYYALWITQFVTSGCFFFVMCYSSVLYQYFGQYWTILPMNEVNYDIEDIPPANATLEMVPQKNVVVLENHNENHNNEYNIENHERNDHQHQHREQEEV